MKQKCKPTGWTLMLLGIFLLQGCFPENRDGCPEDMYLSFSLQDEYEAGDYDSRVASDIQLYMVRGEKLIQSIDIPYEDIRSSQPWVIRKDEEMQGELYFVAWAAGKSAEDPDIIPKWTADELLSTKTITLTAHTVEGIYLPAPVELYLGTYACTEAVDEVTRHEIFVKNASCRIEVYVTDLSQTLLSQADHTFVELHGTMSEMDMYRQGRGTEAVVYTDLEQTDEEGLKFSTGRFGVLPSSREQTVRVEIYAGDERLQTLYAPQESLPKGAESGGMIVFDYTLGEAHYFLTIDDYTQKIVIVQEM